VDAFPSQAEGYLDMKGASDFVEEVNSLIKWHFFIRNIFRLTVCRVDNLD